MNKIIKFYLPDNTYMGWKKYKSFADNYLEIKSWVDSGNKIKIKDTSK